MLTWPTVCFLAVVLLTRTHCLSARQILAVSELDNGLVQQDHMKTLKSVFKRDGPVAIEIEGINNFAELVINATIGTPAQAIRLSVDTVFADLVILSTSNPSCQDASSPCKLGTFDNSSSVTYDASELSAFNLTYADGSSMQGHYAKDDVQIGGLVMNNLQVGLAERTNANVGVNVLGLGYISSQLTPSSYANVPLRLYIDGIIQVIGYSIWFDGANQTSGRLVFGAIDTGKFNGSLATVPISLDLTRLTYTYAKIKVDNISASIFGKDENITQFQNSTINVILDAGSSTLTLPQSLVAQISQYLGIAMDNTSGLLVQNKSDFRNDTIIRFTFGPVEVQIPVIHLAVPVNNDQMGFLFDSNADVFSLGIPFFRNAYLVFDYSHNQVSLAPLSYSSASNLLMISQNGVNGATSTAPLNATNSTNGNRDPQSPTDPPTSGLSSTEKTGIGIGIGLGVPSILALTVVIFIRRKRKDSASGFQKEVALPSNAGNTNKYNKAELPSTNTTVKMREKAELSATPHRHELENQNASPTELPASMPAAYEMETR